MPSGFDSEHYIDDAAAFGAIRAKRMHIMGADKCQMPRFQLLRFPVDPMAGLAAFDQKHFEKIMIMRAFGIAFGQGFSREVKRLIGVLHNDHPTRGTPC